MMRSAHPKFKFTGKNMVLIARRQHLPNGNWKKVEMIAHPGAVCIVPFLDSRRLVFMRQYRPAVKSYLYELPAGTLDAKEDYLTCGRRELREETGYTAKQWTRVGKIYPLPAYSDEEIVIYKAKNLRLAETERDEDEIIEVRPMSLAQVKKLFAQGKIIDAKTICALTFCRIL